MRIADRILGAVGLALGVAFIWGATHIQTGFIVDPLGPKTFPFIIGGLLAIGSVFVLLMPDPEPTWPRLTRALEVVAAAAVLIGYAQALDPAGFVVSTALAGALLSWRLGSRLLGAALTGIGISVGIYVLFHLVLGMSLAKGPWGF
jgi:putative tricarboxylic transport membrane protein